MQKVTIELVDAPEDAPNYGGTDFQPVTLTKCIIVNKGTVSGKPTVDLQFEDGSGIKYIAMASGDILERLGDVLRVKRDMDKGLSQ